MTAESPTRPAVEPVRTPRLPPRWVVRIIWILHRAVPVVTRGRRGLGAAAADRAGYLRLTTVGRRTGRERRSILAYVEDGPNLVTIAMNGWAEAPPAWWLNLAAQPDALVELPGGSRAVRARAADPQERTRLWPMLHDGPWGDIDGFAAGRSQEAPVVILEPRG